MTDSATSDERFGRCINNGHCSLADKRTPIPLKPGDALVCPECGKPIIVIPPAGKKLVDTGDRIKPPPKRLILMGLIISALVAFGVYYNLFRPLPEEVAQEEEEVGGEYVPPVEQGAAAGEEMSLPRASVNLFTLGATPETRGKLAPALAAAFMRSRGCAGVSQQLTTTGELRLSCDQEDKRLILTIAATDAASAFELRPGRRIDVLVTASPANAARPRDITAIGFDPVAVIVHPSNSLRRLSVPQLAAVFSGKTGDFGAVGGTPGPIRLLAPPDTSNEVQAFAGIVLADRPLPAATRRLADVAAVAAAVSADRGAIGLVSPDRIGTTRALGIGPAGGVALGPGADAIAGGRYPLSRRLNVEIPRGSTVRNAAPFASFAASRAGQQAVKMAGFIPMTAAAAGDDPGVAPARYPPILEGAERLPGQFRFQSGTSALDPASEAAIARAVSEIKRRRLPPDRLLVVGFSDPSPDAQGVSQRFAEAVARGLDSAGITPGAVRGLGDAMPIGENSSPAGRDKNRRAEIWFKP